MFPPQGADAPPGWLGWSLEEWRRRGAPWLQGLDNVLNTERYLARIFQTDVRIAEAQKEVVCFQDEQSDRPSKFRSLAAAEAWLRRVQLGGTICSLL